MNGTVRDVGGLILAIILMISMYGTYRGGSVAVGGQAFGAMHRMVARAFGRVSATNGSFSDMIQPGCFEELQYRIPKSAWKKGIQVRDGRSSADLGSVITMNKDGSFRAHGYNGATWFSHNSFEQTQQFIYDAEAQQNGHYQRMHYDPQKNMLLLTH